MTLPVKLQELEENIKQRAPKGRLLWHCQENLHKTHDPNCEYCLEKTAFMQPEYCIHCHVDSTTILELIERVRKMEDVVNCARILIQEVHSQSGTWPGELDTLEDAINALGGEP